MYWNLPHPTTVHQRSYWNHTVWHWEDSLFQQDRQNNLKIWDQEIQYIGLWSAPEKNDSQLSFNLTTKHVTTRKLWLITSLIVDIFTWRWIKTTDPSRRQVPPCLSTWSIRKICKNRIPRIAEVANTWPFEPTDNTIIDAETTIKSINATE